jgi:uncharacterized protein YbjT (DUF2867 family)
MAPHEPRILVTGANGQIGLQLFERLPHAGFSARAVVRSQRAADAIAALPDAIRPEVQVLDYADRDALAEAAVGCAQAVHLVGILKEGGGASYKKAHEDTCEALASAAEHAGLTRVVYVSIFGADPGSDNRCLASKGRAQQSLLDGPVPASILKVPMVVGPEDPASRALRAQAGRPSVSLVAGGTTLHQPIDIRDLLSAIVACLQDESGANHDFELGGPETLSHRDLVLRAAALHGNTPRIRTLPLFAAKLFAGIMERVSSNPPITPSMLGVLQHDDQIDSRHAVETLGLRLTPLDETLARYIGPEAEAS